MNIALSAVVIFILLMPPIVFYLSFSYGRYSKAGPNFSFLDGILSSAVISLFVHACALLILGKEVRFDIFLKLLGGELKDLEVKITNQELTRCTKAFALYNFFLLIFFVLLGRLTRFIVIHFNYNITQSEVLRLNNRWWFLFNAFKYNNQTPDLVLIDAVVETKECTIIYSGWLLDFVCDGEKLDRIYLEYVVKRKLKIVKDEGMKEEQLSSAVPIPGDIFSLSYDNIINLNLRFLTLRETND